MLENHDIERAVRGGVISTETARALRNRAALSRGVPAADEERLHGGITLADVMTSIGLWLVFSVAVAFTVSNSPIAAGLLAPFCWGLAEYFTRRRQQPIASMLLFVFFLLLTLMAGLAIGMIVAGIDQRGAALPARPNAMAPLTAMITAAVGVMACSGWWLRFRLPIAYAAAVITFVNLLVHIARIIWPYVDAGIVGVVLLMVGLCLFLLAMWWDMSDVRRETRRSDVAFWLHAAAGFQIAGASYRLLFGVQGAPEGWDRLYSFTPQAASASLIPLAGLLLIIFCWIALIVDRRSLIMSALAFLVQMQFLDGLSASFLPATLVLVGIMIVILAIFWSRLRTIMLVPLPLAIRAQLPRDAVSFSKDRPVY